MMNRRQFLAALLAVPAAALVALGLRKAPVPEPIGISMRVVRTHHAGNWWSTRIDVLYGRPRVPRSMVPYAMTCKVIG
jgi:hypothetical protein